MVPVNGGVGRFYHKPYPSMGRFLIALLLFASFEANAVQMQSLWLLLRAKDDRMEQAWMLERDHIPPPQRGSCYSYTSRAHS